MVLKKLHTIQWQLQILDSQWIEDVLKALEKEGKMLGIATSKPADTANRVLSYFGLRDYFSVFCAAPLNGIGGEKAGRIGGPGILQAAPLLPGRDQRSPDRPVYRLGGG